MSLAAWRSVGDILTLLAGMYIDDYFEFGSSTYFRKAMHDFTVDAESCLSSPDRKLISRAMLLIRLRGAHVLFLLSGFENQTRVGNDRAFIFNSDEVKSID